MSALFKLLSQKTDEQLNFECANLLSLASRKINRPDAASQVLDIAKFDPISNSADWGIIISRMLNMGFELSLDSDGVIVNSPNGMITFDDDNVGRRLVKAFLCLGANASLAKAG